MEASTGVKLLAAYVIGGTFLVGAIIGGGLVLTQVTATAMANFFAYQSSLPTAYMLYGGCICTLARYFAYKRRSYVWGTILQSGSVGLFTGVLSRWMGINPGYVLPFIALGATANSIFMFIITL